MIKINSIGFNWVHADIPEDNKFFISRPHGTFDYLFLLFRSKASMVLGAKHVTLNSPAVFIYPKEREQKYGYAGEPFINDWFHFDSETDSSEIETFLETLDIPVQTPVYMNDIQTISGLVKDLEYEYRQFGLFQENLIDAKIRALFCKIACICHQEKHIPQTTNKYRKNLTDIRNKIYSLHENKGTDNIPMLAKQVNMSVSHFHHVYKVLFNSSPGQDIIKSRLSYACILLSSESTPVADIAAKCGYANVEHFIRQFKQYMKCTPREYRNFYDI